MNMTSPLIRLTGSGTANISSQALDYKLITSIVSTLEGQGGNKRDELYGVEVPFIIDGTMSEPEFSLDTKALLGSKIKEETNKLKDSIFKKFGFYYSFKLKRFEVIPIGITKPGENPGFHLKSLFRQPTKFHLVDLWVLQQVKLHQGADFTYCDRDTSQASSSIPNTT